MESTVTIETLLKEFENILKSQSEDLRILTLNSLRILLHAYSPFQGEPIDDVKWIKCEYIDANDYNPNTMASLESKLLARSLEVDGFTQPLVVRRSPIPERYIIVDGFHRYTLCRTQDSLHKKFKGNVPVVILDYSAQANAIATTIRHNRARGKHQIQAMSELVRELALLGWSDGQIGCELGMEQDEVLRLKQLNGLLEMFRDRSFSQAWTV